jgi:hypothetical protein
MQNRPLSSTISAQGLDLLLGSVASAGTCPAGVCVASLPNAPHTVIHLDACMHTEKSLEAWWTPGNPHGQCSRSLYAYGAPTMCATGLISQPPTTGFATA